MSHLVREISYHKTEQVYSEFPLTDSAVDISSQTSLSSIVDSLNYYLGYQSAGFIPNYSVTIMNSNTWAAGLLSASGVSANNIISDVYALQAASVKNAIGYDNYGAVVPCFQQEAKEPPNIIRPNDTPNGGCSSVTI